MAPAVPLVIALVAGVVLIAPSTLAGDEAFSATSATLSPKDLVRLLFDREMNGAAHYVLLRVAHLGNASAWALRLPSLVAVLAAAILLWRFLLPRTGIVVTTIAVAVFSLDSSVMQAATTSRAYALAILCATASLVLTDTVARTRSTGAAVALGLIASVGLYSHFFFAFVLVAQLAYLVANGAGRVIVRAALPVLAVASLPLVYFLVTGGGDHGQNSWIPPTTVHRAVTESLMGLMVTGGGPERVLGLTIVIPPFALGLVWLRRGATVSREIVLAGLCGCAPFAFGIAASLSRPLLVGRYFSVALPALVIFSALCAAELARRVDKPRWAWMAMAPALVAVAIALPHANDVRGGAWLQTLRYVRVEAEPGDGLDTYAPITWTSVAYYLPSSRSADVIYRADDIRRQHTAVTADAYGPRGCWRRTGLRRLWLLSSVDVAATPGPGIATYAKCMRMRVIASRQFDGIAMFLLSRAG